MERGLIRCQDMSFFSKSSISIFILAHGLLSFVVLIVGFAFDYFIPQGEEGFLLFIIVALCNFPGVKTLGLFWSGFYIDQFSGFCFYLFSIVVTDVYVFLILKLFKYIFMGYKFND